VQEALTNVMRHAHARQVWISLTSDDRQVYLSVRDDGQGFDLKDQSHPGLGLLGMRERVIMVNGMFMVESAPGTGTMIKAIIPIPPVEATPPVAVPLLAGKKERLADV
jgi:signal transduction histidine kinase